MKEVIDILTKERKEVNQADLVFLKKKSIDYILSIPHGGAFIPTEFEHKLNIGKQLLIGSDLFTEQIYDTGKGITIASRLNSNLVNMSRFREGSKDKSLPKHLQRDPLHAHYLVGNKVLREEYSSKEKEKITKFYDKYHYLIKKAIQEMKQEHSFALMFDCHSMSPIGLKNAPDEGKQRPDFTIGTLDDTSAHPEIISTFYETLETEAEKSSLTVKKNYPYKGGFITQKYGKPSENIHVIQIEVNKSAYMNENFKLNPEGLKRINSIISKTMKTTSEETKKLFSKKLKNLKTS